VAERARANADAAEMSKMALKLKEVEADRGRMSAELEASRRSSEAVRAALLAHIEKEDLREELRFEGWEAHTAKGAPSRWEVLVRLTEQVPGGVAGRGSAVIGWDPRWWGTTAR
jgi:hypothetical protein